MHQEHNNRATQNKLKQLKPGLVASYDLWPGTVACYCIVLSLLSISFFTINSVARSSDRTAVCVRDNFRTKRPLNYM